MVKRLFIAFTIPDKVKEIIRRSIILPGSLKIVSGNNLHITVLFLGDVEDVKIPEITCILDSLITIPLKINAEINKTGQFPEKGNPKIIYLTSEKENLLMKDLAGKIRDSLKILGYGDNKPFKYHITVARNKNDKYYPIPKTDLKINFQLEKIVLFESILNKNGPEYISLFDKELG